MDFSLARSNMIEQQIRPWNVLDQSVLDLLTVVKREHFVPKKLQSLAFSDCDLPILVNGETTGQHMLTPKLEARLLQTLALNPSDKVLEIGAGSGYMAALMAQKCTQVTSIEIAPHIAQLARNNLESNSISRVKVIDGCGFKQIKNLGQFDAIALSGSCEVIPEALVEHLNPEGRLIGIFGTGPALSAVLIEKAASGTTAQTALFETSADALENAPRAESFQF